LQHYVKEQITESILGVKNASQNDIVNTLNKAIKSHDENLKMQLKASLKLLESEMNAKIERISKQNQMQDFYNKIKLREMELEEARLNVNKEENSKLMDVIMQERQNENLAIQNVPSILNKEWLSKILWFLLISWIVMHGAVMLIEAGFTAVGLFREQNHTAGFEKMHQQFLFLLKETTGKIDEMVRMFLSYMFGLGGRNFDSMASKLKLNNKKN
jgi:hypothetical protein